MFKHIVVATDGSPASAHAATLAVGLARTHGAKLTAVYVVDPYPYMGVGELNPLGFQAYMAAAQQMAAAAHAQVDALCQKDGAPIALQARLVEDMGGSHGRTGLMRLMLGSVATKVVAESPIPVLVTR